MSKTNSLHYHLCEEGAKWLKRRRNAERYETPWQYIAVELCVYGCENPDIWAFNGWSTIVVEVKVSRSDFHNDKKKWWMADEFKTCVAGNYRYYLTPKGLLEQDDLPQGVGLLEYDEDTAAITRTIRAERCDRSNHADMIIMASILRRENFPKKIFNFRQISD